MRGRVVVFRVKFARYIATFQLIVYLLQRSVNEMRVKQLQLLISTYIKDHKPIARSLNALYCNKDCFTNPTQRGNLMFKKNIEGYM